MTQGTTMDYYQEIVEIGGVNIPLIHFEGHKYLPVSYVVQKLLLRDKSANALFIKNAKDKPIKKFVVEYPPNGSVSNKQLTNCIEINEMARLLEKTQVVRLTTEKRQSQNRLHEYLGIELMSLEEYESDTYNVSTIDSHENHVKLIIQDIINSSPNISGRTCSSCLKHYPLDSTFFYFDATNNNLNKQCIKCKQKGNFHFKGEDKNENRLRRNGLNDSTIELYNERPIETLYECYRKGEIATLEDGFYTTDNLKLIISLLHLNNEIGEWNINKETLQETFKINLFKFNRTTIDNVYQWLYGDEFYLEKWKYPLYKFKNIKLTPEIAIRIFNNYLSEFNITIGDPFSFDYQEVIVKCGIRSFEKQLGGLCAFFVYYWNGKYAGYQFRNIGNYYRWNRNGVLSDLRFLVEKDMKLQIEKMPLYVTKSSLRSIAPPLWNHIVNNKNGSIYEWFNELYPNQFDEADFEIGRYRNNFDSIEEEQVDGVLREYLDNVIYNYNNSNQVVSLKGKRPDWFVLSENGVWIIEYLGMYLESQKKNEIISSYIDSTHEKMKLYDELKGYSYIYLYPSDIKNGFEGVRNKIAVIG